MEKFAFQGTPLAVGSTRNGRSKFFLITNSEYQYIRCIFSGHPGTTEKLEEIENSNEPIKVYGKIHSEITTRTGRKYTVYYPSEIRYGFNFEKTIKEK